MNDIKTEEDSAFLPKVFTVPPESIGTFLIIKVKKNTKEQSVCVPGLIKDLGFSIKRYDSDIEKGYVNYTGSKATIYLSSKNSVMDNNMVALLLVSDFVLRFDYKKPKKIIMDVFSLKEILKSRESRQLFLATRLAIPAHMIEKMGSLDFDFLGYSEKYNHSPSFLSTVRQNDFVKGCLDRDGSFNIINSILDAA